MQNIKCRIIPAVIIYGLLAFQACNKDNDNPPADDISPVITSVSPGNGVFNTVVAINGSNFTNKDTVKINGKIAEIVSVSATQISVKVPTLAGSGDVTITTADNKTIRGPLFQFKYTAAATTLAGDGTEGYKDGAGSQAQFSGIWQMCIDAAGNLFLTETAGESVIRKITPEGNVSTYAKGSASSFKDMTDGPVATTKFYIPFGLTVNQKNEMYVTEGFFIRKIDLNTATITKFTGKFPGGDLDGVLSDALFNGVTYITSSVAGDLYVFDENNKRIRKIDTDDIVFTTSLHDIDDLSAMVSANSDGVYFGGWSDCRVRHLSSSGIETTIAGANETGYKDGSGGDARFRNIVGITEDVSGNLFVADRGNNRIRLIDKNKNVVTVAGNGERAFQDGTGDNIKFAGLEGMVAAGEGILYVFDGYRIRKLVIQ